MTPGLWVPTRDFHWVANHLLSALGCLELTTAETLRADGSSLVHGLFVHCGLRNRAKLDVRKQQTNE